MISSPQNAYRVTYTGTVQGVGFRFTVLRFARQYDTLTGYVRNNPDGSVELQVEGNRSDVESLLEDIVTGPHAAYIRNVQAQALPVGEQYTSFDIKY
jgi:acylphosphatase